VTRLTGFDAEEAHALHFELAADKQIQIHTACDHVPPEDRGRLVAPPELLAQSPMNFLGEKGDLAFEVRFVIKVAVSFNASSGNTADLIQFKYRVLPWQAAVVTPEIMSGRNVKMQQFHF